MFREEIVPQMLWIPQAKTKRLHCVDFLTHYVLSQLGSHRSMSHFFFCPLQYYKIREMKQPVVE